MRNAERAAVMCISVTALAVAAHAANAATFGLSPSEGSYRVGETFTVTILLDTEGQSVDGVDINALNFDPTLLEVVDAQPGVAGIQIAPGSLMAATAANVVDESAGRIVFSQVTGSNDTYKGDGPEPLADVTFRSLKSGSARVTFDYREGETRDTNVAAVGSDVLREVENGSYRLGNPSLGSVFLDFLKRLLGLD